MAGRRVKIRRAIKGAVPASEHLGVGEALFDVDKGSLGIGAGEQEPRWIPGIDIDGNMIIPNNTYLKSEFNSGTKIGFEAGHFKVYVNNILVMDIDPASNKLFSELDLTNDIVINSLSSNDPTNGFSFKDGVFKITAPLEILGDLNLSASEFGRAIFPTQYTAGDALFAGNPHIFNNPSKIITDLNETAALVYKSGSTPERSLDLKFNNKTFTGINANFKGSTDYNLIRFLPKFGSSFSRSTESRYTNANGISTIAAINEPVLTFDPYTGESLGLRVESDSKNLVLNSSDLTLWDNLNLSALSVTRAGWTSVGLHNPYMLTEANTGEHTLQKNYFSLPLSTSLAASIYIEIPDVTVTSRFALTLISGSNSFGSKFTLKNVGYNADTVIQTGTGSLSNIRITRITNTIFRIGIAGKINPSDNTAQTVTVKFQTLNSAGNTSFTSAASGIAYINDVQLEQNTRVSSYISTNSVSLTRKRDLFTLNLSGGNFSFSNKRSLISFTFKASNYLLNDTIFSLYGSVIDYSYELKADANSNLILYTGPSGNLVQTNIGSVDSNDVTYLLNITNGPAGLDTLNIGRDKNDSNGFNGHFKSIFMYR